VTSSTTSPDGTHLFVLSAGDTPRVTTSDELPSLTMIDATTFTTKAMRYTMPEPLSDLAVDPLGHWVVAYAGSTPGASFVQNPNQIIIFDLTTPPSASNPVSRTIRSFGGTPQQLTFTQELTLPAGPRRLLLIETDIDVTLLDLDHAFDSPPRPEITVPLTSGSDAQQVTPAGLVVDDSPPAAGTTDTQLPRIALRTTNDTNVYTMDLVASPAGSPNDFVPTINLTDVGGTPSDIAFVHTDAGLRVAAIVPSTSNAVLVQPDTSLTTVVALPAAYSQISLITSAVASSSSTDVALLWSGSGTATGLAFWTLGNTVGQPYRSIQVLGVSQSIQGVSDVPAPNAQLKVLTTQGNAGFLVLDLVQRTAAPLDTSSAASLTIAPDGLRMWAYESGGTNLAAIDLATLTPVPLTTSPPIAAAYDVARSGTGRSLIVLDGEGSEGATVFDALNPDTATSRRIPALLLEAL
jgi:hypothetical protein